MKMAFFGSSLVSAYWNGAATYYRGIIRYLNGRGHQVTFYEPDAYGRQAHRDIPDPEWARVVVYPATVGGVFRSLEEAKENDLLIKASGVGVFDQLLERAVLDLKAPHRNVLFWDVDAPATLERMTRNSDDLFRGLVPLYDLIFTYGGGDPVVTAYKAFGAKDCVPIYNALDPATHYPAEKEERFSGTLNFIGNRLPDREHRAEEFFFKAAARMPDRRFILGGNGWRDKNMPANIFYLGHVYTRDHNALNSSARAVLNISRESMARNGYSPATRVFEAAGAAACIITDDWPGVDHFLDPGEEILVARDGTQVCELLQGLTESSAAGIGEAARKRILAQHTYEHRAAQVEKILQG